MGVKITMQDYEHFFAKVVSPAVAKQVVDLCKENKLTVAITFFGVQFRKNGVMIAGCSLNTNTNSLMKGQTPPPQKAVAVELIMGCVEAARLACEGKAKPGKMVKPDDLVEDAPVVMQATPHPFKVEMKPEPKVIPLKNAKALMQPVRGTSQSSKYYAVALSDKVKVAYRLANHTLSVRVEGMIPAVTRTRLSGIGFSNNGEYMSIHMEIGGVEVGQVLGGLLMRMGVSFDAMVTNYQELK